VTPPHWAGLPLPRRPRQRLQRDRDATVTLGVGILAVPVCQWPGLGATTVGFSFSCNRHWFNRVPGRTCGLPVFTLPLTLPRRPTPSLIGVLCPSSVFAAMHARCPARGRPSTKAEVVGRTLLTRLSASLRTEGEKETSCRQKKHDSSIITCAFFITRGSTQWVYSVGQFLILQEQIKDSIISVYCTHHFLKSKI
jgi:hypothetical protein